jgi:NADPH-dependent 2,4-dienoyl-CoA reductase/sulfur reductase-like enzyme
LLDTQNKWEQRGKVLEKSIVIVGAGHAGVSCAASLRSLGFEGTLTIIDSQEGCPVEKPPLSKGAILNGCDKDYSIPLLRPKNWYGDNRIDLKTGIEVTSIDRGAKKINLSDENSIPYTKLVIATGATPIELGITKAHPQSFTLRTSNDAKKISKAASNFKSALIIGGGYIGLEVAASLTERGLKVTVVESESRLLAKVSSSIIAERLVKLHEKRGVSFIFNDAVVGVDQFEKGFRAVLHTETHITAEMIVTGVGVVPESFLASSCSLAQNDNDKNSICVDENCETSDSSIFAIGDVARRIGTEKRIESVDNAQEDGRLVAAFLMREDTRSRSVPWFWSDQYDKTLQIAGLVPVSDPDIETFLRPGKKDDGFSLWSFVDKKLRSVEAFSDPGSFMIGKKFLSEGLSPLGLEVSDASVDLKTVFKSIKIEAKNNT